MTYGTAIDRLPQYQAQQTRLQTLERRLELVRGIREGMGGKRLDELTRKKLQRRNPELVARRDAEERLRREQQAEEALRLPRENAQSGGRGVKIER